MRTVQIEKQKEKKPREYRVTNCKKREKSGGNRLIADIMEKIMSNYILLKKEETVEPEN